MCLPILIIFARDFESTWSAIEKFYFLMPKLIIFFTRLCEAGSLICIQIQKDLEPTLIAVEKLDLSRMTNASLLLLDKETGIES